MTENFAPEGATAKLCLHRTLTLDRSSLEDALADLDQAVAANDHLAYEKAYQSILAMIPQPSVMPADVLQDYTGPSEASPEALAAKRLANRDARRR